MGRSPCCEKAHTNKGAWTKEEDERLIAHIREHGEGSWRALPKVAGLLRCGKSCRLRWINYLRPDLKRGNFTLDEDDLIIKLHSLLGNKWSLIAARLPGRTDNEIKNYWNTHIRRKLLSRGIDPVTHRPLNDTPPMETKQANPNAADAADRKSGNTTTATTTAAAVKSEPEPLSARTLHQQKPRCPDLNLELCISPPLQAEAEALPVKPEVKREGGGLCFKCSLGMKKEMMECKCNTFLSLGMQFLDYRSLQMK